MHRIPVDEPLQEVGGVGVVEFLSAHTLVEIGVRLQVLLHIRGMLVNILEILLRGPELLVREKVHRCLEFVLRGFEVFGALRLEARNENRQKQNCQQTGFQYLHIKSCFYSQWVLNGQK